MRLLLLAALFFALAASTAYAAKNKPACTDDEAATHAIDATIQEGNDTDSDIDVRVIKVCGDYAKAAVTAVEDQETETAYLKKSGGKWEILDLGTGTDPADLDIPKEAW